MARSFHITRTQIEREKRFDNASMDAELIDKKIGRLEKQHRMKKVTRALIRSERSAPPKPDVSTSLEAIAIEIIDDVDGTTLDYGLSIADVRAVLNRLPGAYCDGLVGIEFRHCKRIRFDSEHNEDFVREDFLPGIINVFPCGCYRGNHERIEIYPFQLNGPVDPQLPWRFLMRAQRLQVLLHELGHHEDRTLRVARGRWGIRRSRFFDEFHAMKVEADLYAELALPYLEEAYPQEVSQLLGWVKHHVNMPLSLEKILGVEKIIREKLLRGPMPLDLNTLANVVKSGSPTFEARRVIADDLEILGYLDDAASLYRRLIEEDPTCRGARNQLARTLMQLGKSNEAFRLVRALLNEDDSDDVAWNTLVALHEEANDLNAALDSIELAMAAMQRSDKPNAFVRFKRRHIHNQIDLRKFENAHAEFDELKLLRPAWTRSEGMWNMMIRQIERELKNAQSGESHKRARKS